MPRLVRCSIIQASNALPATEPLAAQKKAMIEKHLDLIRQAAKAGAQIVCLQEIFNGPYFCAEQLGGRQLALGGVFAEFRVEKGIVEACTGCVGGGATEINGVEARPIRGGEAHGTGLATCVKRATRKRKGVQSFARGTDRVDLAVRRGIMRCGYGVRTFSHDLASAHDDGSERAPFAVEDIRCCERDGPSEELWIW